MENFSRYCTSCATGYTSNANGTCPNCGHRGFTRRPVTHNSDSTSIENVPERETLAESVAQVGSLQDSSAATVNPDLSVKLLEQLIRVQVSTSQKFDELIAEQQKTRFYIRWGFGAIGVTLLLAFYGIGVKVNLSPTIFRQYP